MNELAEKLRKIVTTLYPGFECTKALDRAADIIASLPDEPEGYRVIAYRKACRGDVYLHHDEQGLVAWKHDTPSGSKYFVLEPIQPQFKPGDIVCEDSDWMFIINKDGDLLNPLSNSTRQIGKGNWHLATEEERVGWLISHLGGANTLFGAYAREVYSEDKP